MHHRKSIFNNLAANGFRFIFFLALWVLCPIFSSNATTLPPDSIGILTTDTLNADSLPSQPDAFKTDVTYQASDSIYFDMNAKVVHLWGNAKLHYETTDLQSSYAWIDFKNNILHAQPTTDSSGNAFGKPVFKDGDKEFHVDTIAYNFKTKKGKIHGLVTKEGEGIIYCSVVKKDPYDNLYGAESRYSTCTDSLHPHFHIHATKLKIIPKKQIITGPANLYIEDVPTPAFVPFGFFPITQGQKKGLMFPTYGESPGIGFFLRGLGYYLPINRHLDLKLLTDIYTNTSWGATVSSSYNYIYKFKGNFTFLYNVIKRGDPDVPTEFSKSKLFKINWNHAVDQKARPGTTFSLAINAQSSAYNRSVPTASYQDLTNNIFNSNINYGYTFGEGRYNITASARHTQNTQTNDVSLSLPDINFSVNSFSPFARTQMIGTPKWYENIRVGYNMRLINQINVKDENLFKPQIMDSLKNGVVHQVPLQLPTLKIFKYATLSPQFRYTEYWYTQTYQKTWFASKNNYEERYYNEMRRAYEWNTSASLVTRIYGFFNINKGNIMTARHTITPRVEFIYQPDFSKPSYDFYRYMRPDSILKYTGKYSLFTNSIIGGPGMGRQGSVSFSLGNNVELKYKTKKDTVTQIKKLSLLDNLSFSGFYNFLADSFQLSNIGISGFVKLYKNINLNFNGAIDPYQYQDGRKFDRYSFDLKRAKFGTLTQGNIALNTSFNSKMISGSKNADNSKFGTETEKKMIHQNPDDFVDFNIPWNITLNYTLNYSRNMLRSDYQINLKQYITFSGDISLSEKWKLQVSSGVDIVSRQFTATSIDLHRNLHCWQMDFNWIPIGPFQRYMFTLKATSQLLQDLKLTRRRDAWDR